MQRNYKTISRALLQIFGPTVEWRHTKKNIHLFSVVLPSRIITQVGMMLFFATKDTWASHFLFTIIFSTIVYVVDTYQGLLVTISKSRIKPSGTYEVLLLKNKWHLSRFYMITLWHSHIAGKSPSHGTLSSAVLCIPLLGVAQACKFWSKNGERNKTLLCNQRTLSKGLLHDLKKKTFISLFKCKNFLSI